MKVSLVTHPNSKNPRIEKDAFDVTHVYVREPALEGKANNAVVNVLSKLYKVPKSRIKLVAGSKSKIKTFEVY
ncbi:MAG: hypothetical protein UU77_C0009G0017 [candidate division WWE3 bacterium GW2011_GWC1_41_7]|jgi:hypothetical protein|uniref:Uncharacterized protein n=2 Tax=Katanobacteria TaxID=422282 RepID=A0A0G0X7Z1_UNCKA|nr:MAG: hypothetical protein UU72_C0043G0007 [candidate division WWE3 bacterium GW2011_GWB1_41_6]KKS21055.1 MAG: hypothetical protein UU77_C0009G0017 [candidate division WWE3 bacterium GW2011_GWC1_41_7]